MHRITVFVSRFTLLLAVLAVLAAPAAAGDRGPYSMEILVDGRPLHEFTARGTSYVEALEGREYTVRLTNHTSRRIAVALSVDGLNSIDAKTGSTREASKWIIGPHASITIDGWQTSRSTARKFFFTTEERSYGAWLGKTRNLGVIAAAVFREKHRRPDPIFQRQEERRRSEGESKRRAAPAEPQSGDRSGMKSELRADTPSRGADSQPRPSDDYAATGIGRELDNRVRHVRFDSESSPAQVISLRYEFHDALARLGVLPRICAHDDDPLARRERSRGFDDLAFAPDPYER